MADPVHREALRRIRIDKRRAIVLPGFEATKETLAALRHFVPPNKPVR